MDIKEQIDHNPIHSPCPDMAGCANPKSELTQNSLAIVRQLRQKFRFKTQSQRNQEKSQYKQYLATFRLGGAL
ncbi:hypothetical protein C9J12_11705 [Photobacterium frigidiphilum]|uniref:Uncharacterized protein n=1 Tax=Photobacterium frigidiphilum TaxID=264736 RepID=A0A2T3JH49_9GAMM|nr:hypothetical protein [Photobacterium frigidiphilum]PSU48279.1 hypothetical protein C9J12_11705 [Photobacterium frigidiphilum]